MFLFVKHEVKNGLVRFWIFETYHGVLMRLRKTKLQKWKSIYENIIETMPIKCITGKSEQRKYQKE